MSTILLILIGIVLYFALAIPISMWLGRILGEIGRYYPPVDKDDLS